MAQTPPYIKILTVGALGTEQLLTGQVIIEEKIDGSQFAFGIDKNSEVSCRSHHQQIIINDAGMFTEAVAHVQSIIPTLERMYAVWREPLWFYAEYLQRPKHNTLAYQRIPKNHLVLFDVLSGTNWLSITDVQEMADSLQIDAVPVLYQGQAPDMDTIKSFLQRESYLGGSAIEGVVIKNYEQLIAMGGKTFPLFCKLVNEKFKERNMREWKENSNKSKLQELIESYRTQARWQKAVQRLEEDGKLKHDPCDIGELMKAVAMDILEEEKENIKEELFNLYWKDIARTAQRGLAEWYKNKLSEMMD